MQLRTIVILIVLLAIIISEAGQSQTLRPIARPQMTTKRRILSATGLREGRVQTASGSGYACDATRLYINEIASDSSFTVMLGNETAIQGLGVGKTEVTERDCTYVDEGTYGSQWLSWSNTRTCGARVTTIHSRMEVTESGFIFTRNKIEDGKPSTESCTFSFQARG